MSVAGIYPASRAMSPSTSGSIPQLSEREAELLEQLPETARTSRPVTHAELHAAVVAMAERHNYSLELEVVGTGFTAVIAHKLRVVANVRGTGDETFYCQYDDESLSRQLAQELARRCGPQIVLPSTGEDGVLVLPEA
ncbi:MAG TPA: hypothetical protein VL326_20665 [Kofleriaceae bacterium]|jgi:hypothetical protein|nr:hypothetical protein [Kofleriaceae bacterium]